MDAYTQELFQAAPPLEQAAATRSPALEAALQAVSDMPAAPPAATPACDAYIAQFKPANSGYAEPVLLEAVDVGAVEYWPLNQWFDPLEQADYLAGLKKGFAGDTAADDLDGARYVNDPAFRDGYEQGASRFRLEAAARDIAHKGWRGVIQVADRRASWPPEVQDLVDAALEGCLDETWTAIRDTPAGNLIVLLGSHPQWRDRDTKALARTLRDAATYLAPEVPMHAMASALDLYDRAKAVYDALDAALIGAKDDAVSVSAVAAETDDLGLALDHAEDELAPYLAERAKRRAVADGPSAVADVGTEGGGLRAFLEVRSGLEKGAPTSTAGGVLNDGHKPFGKLVLDRRRVLVRPAQQPDGGDGGCVPGGRYS